MKKIILLIMIRMFFFFCCQRKGSSEDIIVYSGWLSSTGHRTFAASLPAIKFLNEEYFLTVYACQSTGFVA